MQFNNTTDKNGILQRYERHSLLGDGVVSGDDLLRKQATADINEAVYELTSDIILSSDEFDPDDANTLDYPISTTPLTLNRDYPLNEISFLKIKRIDVSWDGTNWYRATPFDSTSFSEALGNETNVDTKFNKTEPKYDAKSNSFWLYPRATQADVDAGGSIRIEYVRSFEEYEHDDSIKEPPIDRPFQDLIAIGAALRNPTLPDGQYQKLRLLYGDRIYGPNGVTFTGGRAAMVNHYGNRNMDEALSINIPLESYT